MARRDASGDLRLRNFYLNVSPFFFSRCSAGGLFPTESHEYEVFRFALSHHQDIPKLVPQVDMVKMGNSFSMTYACKYCVSIVRLIALAYLVLLSISSRTAVC